MALSFGCAFAVEPSSAPDSSAPRAANPARNGPKVLDALRHAHAATVTQSKIVGENPRRDRARARRTLRSGMRLVSLVDSPASVASPCSSSLGRAPRARGPADRRALAPGSAARGLHRPAMASDGCGPRPRPERAGGGEIVAIRQEGDELAVRRRGPRLPHQPVLRPDADPGAGGPLARRRTARPGGPAARRRRTDPRKAMINTLVVATTDTHIDVIETGRYEIVAREGALRRGRQAHADLRPGHRRTKPAPAGTRRLRDQGAAPRSRAEASAPAARRARPARLEVRPSKKLLRTGESFQFRAAVLDAKGCAHRDADDLEAPGRTLRRASTVDANGNVTVGSDAPEGVVEIVATAAGKSARVTRRGDARRRTTTISSRSSGLNAAGENDAASVVDHRLELDRSRRGARRRSLASTTLVFIGSSAAPARPRPAWRGCPAVEATRERRCARARGERAPRGARSTRCWSDAAYASEEHAAQKRAHEESVAAAAEADAHAAKPRSDAPRGVRRRCGPGRANRDDRCPRCGRDFGRRRRHLPVRRRGSSRRPDVAAAFPTLGGSDAARAAPRSGARSARPAGAVSRAAQTSAGRTAPQLVLLN